MVLPKPNAIEGLALRCLLALLAVFAYWTLAHQIATFTGASWTSLLQATTWLLIPVFAVGFLWAGAVTQQFTNALEQPYTAGPDKPLDLRPTLWIAVVSIGVGWVTPSYPIRYSVVLGCAAAWLVFTWQSCSASDLGEGSPPTASHSSDKWTWLWLGVFLLIAVGLVVFANRSDFDDAEYLQLALQTLRHPDKPMYGFDAALGSVIDQFRFAPYRTTSYESFVALVSTLNGQSLLDTYYLILPTVWAALSVLVAFVFLRWFLPRPWAILGIGLFLLIAITWGEAHVAYGNRMYVRLFQGKGLLVVLTTPLTVLMALLWMRRPSWSIWVALFAMQLLAVGVSSSGIVVTLFATTIGLAAGWLTQPRVRTLARAVYGAGSLSYPIAVGLWLKFASSAAGKVEEIGTYLPIEASLGGGLRQMLVLGVSGLVLILAARAMTPHAPTKVQIMPAASLGWLLLVSHLVVLNPFLIGYITEATSRNMNWRLAWTTPMPLLLAASFSYVLMLASCQRSSVRFWILPLAVALVLGFAIAGQPTLRASNNNLSWKFWQHKLPPEYADAVALAAQIRARADQTQPITVLVESRVGTWLTFVAPEFRLIMPGHGYPVTLKTILPTQEYSDRVKLVGSIDAILDGDHELLTLAQRYGVTVIARKNGAVSDGVPAVYELSDMLSPGSVRVH